MYDHPRVMGGSLVGWVVLGLEVGSLICLKLDEGYAGR